MSVQRNLDGVYFRVKRGENWENICFSDLTPEEREEVCKDRSAEWFRSLAYHLANCLQRIGEDLDIACED